MSKDSDILPPTRGGEDVTPDYFWQSVDNLKKMQLSTFRAVYSSRLEGKGQKILDLTDLTDT